MRASVLKAGLWVAAINATLGMGVALAAESGGETLEEVIVTAEKRVETAQKTPRAITVVSAEEIQKTAATTLDTVLRNIPGVAIQGGFNQLYVRGIGSNSDPGQGESSVTINVDGANQFAGSATGVLNSLMDVERIEVVRGPQGAVDGRNAIAGSVNIVSKEPELEKFGGNAGVKFGNYDSHTYNAALNLPVGDTLAFRLVGMDEAHDGYIHNVYTVTSGSTTSKVTQPSAYSEDVKAARLRALWKPTEDLKFLVTYNYLYDRSNNSSGVPNLSEHPNDPWANDTATTGPGATGASYTKTWSGNFEWNLHWGVLTAIPARTTIQAACNTAVSTVCSGAQQQTSYELRLQSPAESRLDWMVGAYRLKSAPFSPTNGGAATLSTAIPQGNLQHSGYTATTVEFEVAQQTIPTTSDAVFAQVKYPLTDVLRLSGSFRYTKDDKSDAYTLYAVQGPGGNNNNATFDSNGNCSNCVVLAQNPVILADTNDKPLTYSAGIEYDVAPQSMLYAMVNTGFKAGGVSPVVVPPHVYDSEKLVAYSVGSKNRFLDNRLQLNAEAYYYHYKGFQINLAHEGELSITMQNGVTYTDPDEFQSTTYNAGVGIIKGVEFEVQALPTSNDRISANLALSQGKYGALDAPLGGPPWFPATFSLTGGTMALHPEITGNVSYTHDFHILRGTLSPRADIRYSSDYYTTAETYLANWPGPAVSIHQGAFWKYDAYVNYVPNDGNWSLNLYGKNLANHAEITYQTPGGTSVTAPRTYGLGFSVSF